jgi:hypothetical protein
MGIDGSRLTTWLDSPHGFEQIIPGPDVADAVSQDAQQSMFSWRQQDFLSPNPCPRLDPVDCE